MSSFIWLFLFIIIKHHCCVLIKTLYPASDSKVNSSKHAVNTFWSIGVKENAIREKQKKTKLRIMGGKPMDKNEFPYIVRMELSTRAHLKIVNISVKHNHLLCSSSAISPIWILTAGHCIEGIKGLLGPMTAEQKLIYTYFELKGVIRYGEYIPSNNDEFADIKE